MYHYIEVSGRAVFTEYHVMHAYHDRPLAVCHEEANARLIVQALNREQPEKFTNLRRTPAPNERKDA
jgi:hypothetical protein